MPKSATNVPESTEIVPSARISKAQKTKFIRIYARTNNGAKAVRDAGIVSAKPRQVAYVLRTNKDIQARIAAEIKKIDAQINISDTSQVERWRDKSIATLGDYIDINPDGSGKINLGKAEEGDLLGLNEYKTTTRILPDGTEQVTESIKLADPVKYDEMLARHRGMFDADNKQKAIPIVLTHGVPGRG